MSKVSSVLEVQGLNKTYQRGAERIEAIVGLSFAIKEPQVMAVAGPSGSGKTTLLSILARFDRPDSGSIHLDGVDLNGIPDHELDQFRNRKLGFVFQHFNLLGTLTAQENVELALSPQIMSKRERRQRASDMLNRVGISERKSHRPNQLSGGQQQRVAIARALVGSPAFVIADEPTGNLDGKTAHDILNLVSTLNRETGTTFIIATHDQRVLDMADSVIRLEDGRLAR